MKIVIKVTSRFRDPEITSRFAQAVGSLLQDGHNIIIVHSTHEERGSDESARNGQGIKMPQYAFEEIGEENRNLVAALTCFGIPAVGICGGIGGICTVRKTFSNGDTSPVEPGETNAHWLEIICKNRGVPVISNLVLASWGTYYLVDCDKLAASCAGGWSADALIYLTSVEGVRNLDGATARWLEINDIEVLRDQGQITQGMLVKLQACRKALTSGVGRVRILPIAHVDSLPLFFRARIDVGTEVIML